MFSRIPIQPNMDPSALYTAVDQNFVSLENESRTTVYKDDDGTPRIILGKQLDGKYGIRASQPGIDVTTAAENQLVFNSERNMFKIYQTGTVPLVINFAAHGASSSGTDIATATITHTLGYPPAFTAYFEAATGARTLVPETIPAPFTANSNAIITLSAQATPTDINFNVYQDWWTAAGGSIPALSQTGTIRYYIMQETAGT